MGTRQNVTLYLNRLSVCVGQVSECGEHVLGKGVLSLVLVCLLHLKNNTEQNT
jgi:hypothetical protein